MSQSLTRPCPCATCMWVLHPAPTSDQDGLDSLQLALAVLILHQRAHLLMCTQTGNHAATVSCNLHWWYFSSTYQAFTIVLICIVMSAFCNLHCVVGQGQCTFWPTKYRSNGNLEFGTTSEILNPTTKILNPYSINSKYVHAGVKLCAH